MGGTRDAGMAVGRTCQGSENGGLCLGKEIGNWGVAGALGKGTGAEGRRTVLRLEADVAVGARGRLTPVLTLAAGTRRDRCSWRWGWRVRRAKRRRGGGEGGEEEEEGERAGTEEARPSWAGEARSVRGSAADLELDKTSIGTAGGGRAGCP